MKKDRLPTGEHTVADHASQCAHVVKINLFTLLHAQARWRYSDGQLTGPQLRHVECKKVCPFLLLCEDAQNLSTHAGQKGGAFIEGLKTLYISLELKCPWCGCRSVDDVPHYSRLDAKLDFASHLPKHRTQNQGMVPWCCNHGLIPSQSSDAEFHIT